MPSVLKFVKRGGAIAATIREDDLAAHSSGAQVPPSLGITRKQELDLPRQVSVLYANKAANYQQGHQYSARQITSSKLVQTYSLAIALTDQAAKNIAGVLEYVAWAGRTTSQIKVSRQYSALEPTDLIQIIKNDGTTPIFRITQKTEDAAGIITFDLVTDDALQSVPAGQSGSAPTTIYSQYASSGAAPAAVSVVSTAGQSIAFLLDISLLRDQDDGIGYYLCGGGLTSGWNGAQVFESLDNGATYSSMQSGLIATSVIWGFSALALGNWTGPEMFDEANYFDVIVRPGQTLSSATELQVLNGANPAIFQNGEIIQFKNAVLIAANTYRISGLLRGRRGTEWAMSNHSTNEYIVFPTTSTVSRITTALSELNISRQFKPVSIGNTLSNTAAQSFTDTGVCLKPYSGVLSNKYRNAAGDLIASWFRRTRVGGGWNNYIDVPLSEASESYSVDIMNGATVVRTITSTTPTITYTAAQQTTDFGSPQPSISMNIYQISALIGRGFPLSVTI